MSSSFAFQSGDIDADGSILYIGVLDSSGNPQVLTMSADLENDAEVSYNPGAGSEIHLKCGNFNAGLVWAIGNFGSVFAVKYDSDLGVYWTDIDEDNVFSNTLKPLVVGPADDYRLLVTEPSTDTLYQAYFLSASGPYWNTVNANLAFDVESAARLDLEIEQILLGGGPYWATLGVYFTPNNAAGFIDITNSLTPTHDGQKITNILFG